MRTLSLIIFLITFSSTVLGECLPTPCYVEQIRVVSCRPVSGMVTDSKVLENSGLEPGQIKALLQQASGAVVQGKIMSSRAFSQCGEADGQRMDNRDVIREYLAVDSSCEALSPGDSVEGFVSTPCCDTLPVDSAECAVSLETLGPIPAWVD